MPEPPRIFGEDERRDAIETSRRGEVSPDAPTLGGGGAPTSQGGDATVSYRMPAAQLASAAASLPMPVRYEMREHLASGGQGDVYRVFDRELGREMVMKLLSLAWNDDGVARARFVQEAQITAQLQHPSIVPVHEIGTLADGRIYYTMAEVRGRTLSSVIHAVHEASRGGWAEEPGGVGFRRLVDAFHRVCEAVGYAHALGVVHRDLKPQNVMIGAFGEVLVLDWGLARIASAPAEGTAARAIRRPLDSLTQAGAVSGTAGYMSPEQAMGAATGPAADVYALGMILREILVGQPPGLGEMLGMPVAIVEAPERPLPAELVAICLRATAPAAADRHPHAGALAQAVAGFLDGAQKRERALALLDQARAVAPRIDALRSEARALERDARALLDPLPPSAPAEAKEPGWALEDRARALAAEAELATLEMTRLVESSLVEADTPEAHALLANHYRAQHEEAEARHDPAARKLEVLVRAHDRGEHAAYLAGSGALTLHTEPPAEIELRRYVLRGRRLVDEHVRHLGRAPLRAVELPHGSYLLVLRAPGCHDVRYPVAIGRQAHWDPRRPGGASPVPVVLPAHGALDDDEVYVPGGPFTCGGDPQAAGEVLPRQVVWVDPFVVRRHPITNAELLAMVNAVVASRDPRAEEIVAGVVPRHRGATAAEPGPIVWPRGADGRFELGMDDEGLSWEPRAPAYMITWHGAMTYAAWLAAATARLYRLPGELEYEKAARGVDARAFPWGDFFDPSWASMRLSRGGVPRPTLVDDFPVDESPYGARGLAGGVVEWCADEYRREGPPLPGGRYEPPLALTAAAPPMERTLRGGCFLFDSFLLRAASRHSTTSVVRDVSLGFRLVRSF